MLYTQGEEVDRYKLGLLNVLAIETDDYESAAWVTEIMIEQYNQLSDWKNLEAIYEQAGNDVKRFQVINDAKAAGFMDASGNWLENN